MIQPEAEMKIYLAIQEFERRQADKVAKNATARRRKETSFALKKAQTADPRHVKMAKNLIDPNLIKGLSTLEVQELMEEIAVNPIIGMNEKLGPTVDTGLYGRISELTEEHKLQRTQ